MDSFMDNGLFAKENNILPYIFTEEERSNLCKKLSAGGVESMLDIIEIVQSNNDMPSLNIGEKICLLLADADPYMKKFESRDSIYSRFYKECKNLTFNKFLYELPNNDSQYDFKSSWRKYMESAEEINFCKSKTHLNDEEMSRLSSIMEKTFIDDKEIEKEDENFLNSIMDESRFQCWIACLLTSLYYISIHEEKEQLPDFLSKLIILSAKAGVENNKSLYNRWLKAVGRNGIRNQIKVLSQMVFKSDHTDSTILYMFLLYYYQESYSDGGEYLFTELIDSYSDTMVKKIKFEEFLRGHQYGKVFCEEYKSYCSSHQIEPKINISSILDMPLNLERDKPSYDKDKYYKLNENRFSTPDEGLDGEYTALSKLYNALKNYGTPSDDYEELFIYRFSGIYQKDAPIEKYRSENKMEWNWTIKQTLPVVIRLLFQEKTGRIPYKAIASYFGIEDTNGFSSLCKSVGQNSLESIRAMLTDCGFTGFDDIVQQIKKGI